MKTLLAVLALLTACGTPPLKMVEDPDGGADAGTPQPAPPPLRKIIFVLETGAGTVELEAAVGEAALALGEGPRFAAVFYGGFAVSGPQFSSATDFARDVFRGGISLGMPLSPAAGLEAAQKLIASDLALAGADAPRTHYRVVVLSRNGDTTCLNGAAQSAACNAFVAGSPPDFAQCARCEVSRAVRALRGQLELQQAGRILVQPVWVREQPDDSNRYALQGLALEGGTQLVETTAMNLPAALGGLDYGPTP